MRDLMHDLGVSVANLKIGEIRPFGFVIPQKSWGIPGEDVKPSAPLEIDGTITHAGEYYVLGVQVKTRLQVRCTRCLSDFERDLNLDFKEEMKRVDQLFGDEEEILDDEENPYFAFVGQEIDLTDIIKEHLILGLPMQRLCKEACKGLCSRCGQDLNKNHCNCDEDEIDPRLQTLKKLLKD